MARTIRYFTSYAGNDSRLADTVLALLKPLFAASNRYWHAVWQYREHLLVGERWHQRLQAEAAGCHFGLLLVSPSFLASDYISRHELPHFVGDAGKPVIPVGLKPVDLQRHDLKGLEAHQIFRLDSHCFSELTTRQQRDRFAIALFAQIEDRLSHVLAAALS